ncbi:hypothetical protein [Novosphingobium sp.]|uniref:hypothetical protein n=1 Tax=Novosphingobium sp. TaxID=1874826 RepID=UPI00273537E9|nr:hypothetical protein [Novosphingobium sp.]MDP3905665.1 hypothetical protein [Novosphingobium sp.]
MKQDHTNTFRLTAAVTAGLTLIVIPQAANAAGVLAGTLIENTASATYSSGSASGSVSSNTVTVKVDELLDVAVAGLTTTPVTAGSTSIVLEYSITNTGNGGEAFNVTVDPAVAGNGFDSVVQTIAYDSNGNGVYDAGVDTVITNGAATSSIAADGSLKVFVIVTLPTGATDASTSQVRLTADAVTGTGAPGTVFTGQGEGGGDAVVGASGASDNATDEMIASLATVALAKTAAIVDPFGGSQPVPGAVITYTLVATVSGSGQAEGLHVTDIIPAGTTYQVTTLKLDGAGLTDGADADAGVASASGIDVDLGTVAGGTTKTVTFDVKIN